MAFSTDVNWEVRTTGNDANGGGFLVSASGTDYSQQDTPQVVFTDLVIGATTTQLSSALNPFTAAHVGNIINITGGTGFTVQRVQIVSVASGIATCDKSCGTASSIGGTGNLGGGLATYSTAFSSAATGNIVWIKTGTYSPTSSVSLPVSCFVFGYGTVHGDGGMATLNPTSSSTIAAINITTTSSNVLVMNLNFTKGGSGTTNGIVSGAVYAGLTVFNCNFTNLGTGIGPGNTYLNVKFCQFYNCGSGVAPTISSSGVFNVVVEDCYFATATSGIVCSNSIALTVSRCVFNGGSYGINLNATTKLLAMNNTFYACTTGGIVLGSLDPSSSLYTAIFCMNNLFYGNSYAIRATAAYPGPVPGLNTFVYNNGLGGQTTANYLNISGTNDVTVPSNPFNNVATPDFSLNSIGGSVCKAAGWQGSSGFGAGPTYPDLGALQTNSGGGGGGTAGNCSFVM